jgi:acetoacetyl-CoA reductase
MSVEHRVALVTGGTGGIGTEICRQLAAQGLQVVASYLPGDEAAAQVWREARLHEDLDVAQVAGDVSSYESSRDMVRQVIERFGQVDILINCAGITRDRTFRKMEVDHWTSVLRTNLDSVFNVTHHVVEGMVERGFGRIVNISSVNGQRGQFGQTNYSAAKAGMHGFTMALAQEVARKGVTVNTISPGYVATAMTDAMTDEIRDDIVSTIPVGRMAEPGEIAHAVRFLCEEQSSYITGANLAVNGGMYMA